MKTIVLNLDDFSPVNSRIDLLLKLRKHFDDFLVSVFAVPNDIKTDWGAYCVRPKLLKEVKKHLSWIQIIPHGLYHNGSEMRNMSYEDMKKTIRKIEESFQRDGLPFEKGFKSPHWRTSEGVVRALDEAGWWMAIDPRQPNMPRTKVWYQYDFPLDAFHLDKEVTKLHGHVNSTKNDIGLCYKSLLSLPKDTKFEYVTQHLSI